MFYFLQIKELSENASFVLYKQCGRGSFSKIHAKSNKIKVSFISDKSKTGKGFNLTWSGKDIQYINYKIHTIRTYMYSFLYIRLTLKDRTQLQCYISFRNFYYSCISSLRYVHCYFYLSLHCYDRLKINNLR